jgi:hypothetical protein
VLVPITPHAADAAVAQPQLLNCRNDWIANAQLQLSDDKARNATSSLHSHATDNSSKLCTAMQQRLLHDKAGNVNSSAAEQCN